ncbi:MAG: hypothetical protein E7537_00415 [Ruminococcaceae bacterium]|nr:hypothetical protein [Oscillospiraceae bacterium]
MIVLPNSFERYLANLRIYVSLSILKHGFKKHHLKNLKKIYFAEAMYNKNTVQSVDINKLYNNILSAVKATNSHLKFNSGMSGNFYINKSLFSLFLIHISTVTNDVTANYSRECICISFNCKNPNPLPYLKELGGYLLKHKTTCLAVIPVLKSLDESIYIESEFEFIFDKFSVVNVFYNNLL